MHKRDVMKWGADEVKKSGKGWNKIRVKRIQIDTREEKEENKEKGGEKTKKKKKVYTRERKGKGQEKRKEKTGRV